MRKLRLHPCGNFKVQYEQELTIFETDFGRIWLWVGLFGLFMILPLIANAYTLYILNMIGIASISALGLNILIGFTGQISLGHGAFFGVGAYTAAILSSSLSFPFWLAVPLGGFVTAMVGMVFGIPSIRLKGLYLTIATLAGQIILEYLFVHWESLTKGTRGIILPTATLFGLEISEDWAFFFVIYLCLIGMTMIAVNLMRSGFGRAFIAIRDNDRAAEGMGIQVFRYKLLSFWISSFYAGFAGALFAYYVMSISAEPFSLGLSIEYIAMVIIGGLGSIPGAIYGAVFISVLNEVLRSLAEVAIHTGSIGGIAISIAPLREFIFGLTIVLFVIFEPKGLAEVWRILRSSFRLWPFSY